MMEGKWDVDKVRNLSSCTGLAAIAGNAWCAMSRRIIVEGVMAVVAEEDWQLQYGGHLSCPSLKQRHDTEDNLDFRTDAESIGGSIFPKPKKRLYRLNGGVLNVVT